MKCSYCDKPAIAKCTCSKPYMCQSHFGEHFFTLGNHPFEKAKVFENKKLNQIRNLAIKRINEIKRAKRKFVLATNTLIKTLETALKAAIGRLDDAGIVYHNLLGKVAFFETDNPKIEELEKMEISVQNVEIDNIRKEIELVFIQDSLGQKKNKPGKEFERVSGLPIAGIDFSTLSFQAMVYASVANKNFNVNICHYKCSVEGEIALKIYEIKNPSYDKNKIKNEVDILETLSAKSAQSTCFLKFYGSHWEEDKIYIAMEYFKDTLMTKISEMRYNKQRFTEAHMINYARELISAHILMKKLGIYHQDIKPDNILVTPNNLLKIIDFSVSVSKTLAATGLHFIQGTQGYMAPELQAHALFENRTKIIYSRPKADVFSLGLVLLQMFTLEELHALNTRENNHLLMKKIEKLPFTWFQTLLKNMLQVDYKIRVSFKTALNFIPGYVLTRVYD